MCSTPLASFLIAYAASACTQAADSAAARPSTPAPSATSSAPVAARSLDPAAAPAPSAPLQLTTLFQGVCPKATIGHLGSQPAFVMDQNVAYFEGNEPKELFRMNGSYQYGLRGMVGEVGGPDAAHAWVMQYYPSRGEGYDANLLFAARKWKDTPYAKGQHARDYRAAGVIEHPDGSVWAYAEEAWHSDESTGTDHFAAWSASGELLDTHVPKADMIGAERLPSGELVRGTTGKKNQVVLRRWSPTKAVTDLVAPDARVSDTSVDTRVGTAHAVLATEAPKGKLAFYRYNGDVLARVVLPAEPVAGDTWTLTRGDDLYVATGGEVLVLHADGTTTREKVPEPGALAKDQAHVWWLATSGVLYAHGAAGFTKVALPDGPWTDPDHAPTKLEYVQTVGTETVVGTATVQPGKNKKRPVTLRTVYSSVSHGEPARCGAPLRPGELGRPALAAKE